MVSFLKRDGSRVTPRRSIGVAVASLVAVSLALAGCTPGEAENDGEKPVLRVGLGVAPQSLDPALDAAPASALYVSLRDLTNEPLIRVTADGELKPGLAVEWGYVDDQNKSFEFTLREGVKFSDGTPLDAEAVKKWLLYFESKGGPLVSIMGKISSIDTEGDSKVRINLESPNPVVTYALGAEADWGLVSSPACVDEPERLALESCGVGPYKLDTESTISGDTYTFVPDENYYDPSKQKWSSVVAKVIETPNSMLQALQAGQLDVAIGDASTVDAAESAGLTVLSGLAGHSAYALDVGGAISEPLADVRVRQAMNYAIDRNAIIDSVLDGEPSYSFPSSDGRLLPGDEDYIEEPYPYDPDKARELLAEAGYADGFTIDHVHTGAFQGQRGIPLASAVAKYLADVGITINIEPYPTPAAWFDANTNNPSAMMFEPAVNAEPMWSQFTTGLQTGGLFNRIDGGWEDPELTALFEKGQVAPVDEQAAIWKAITKRVRDQAYFLPVLSTKVYIYTNGNVDGIQTGVARYYPPATEWSPR